MLFVEPEPLEPIVEPLLPLVVDAPFWELDPLVPVPLPLVPEPVVCAWAVKVAMPTSMVPKMIAFFITLSFLIMAFVDLIRNLTTCETLSLWPKSV